MGVGAHRHATAALPPRKRLGGSQGRSGRVQKISPPTGIRPPDSPARSESLYRLRCLSLHTELYCRLSLDWTEVSDGMQKPYFWSDIMFTGRLNFYFILVTDLTCSYILIDRLNVLRISYSWTMPFNFRIKFSCFTLIILYMYKREIQICENYRGITLYILYLNLGCVLMPILWNINVILPWQIQKKTINIYSDCCHTINISMLNKWK
jgi:hypothetical protein